MSQYRLFTESGRLVLHGCDKPTGGFFYTVFYRDDELTSERMDDVVTQEDGMTLHELVSAMKNHYNLSVNEEKLRQDWINAPEPTVFQQVTAQMFNKDLPSMIARVNASFEMEKKAGKIIKELGYLED